MCQPNETVSRPLRRQCASGSAIAALLARSSLESRIERVRAAVAALDRALLCRPSECDGLQGGRTSRSRSRRERLMTHRRQCDEAKANSNSARSLTLYPGARGPGKRERATARASVSARARAKLSPTTAPCACVCPCVAAFVARRSQPASLPASQSPHNFVGETTNRQSVSPASFEEVDLSSPCSPHIRIFASSQLRIRIRIRIRISARPLLSACRACLCVCVHACVCVCVCFWLVFDCTAK